MAKIILIGEGEAGEIIYRKLNESGHKVVFPTSREKVLEAMTATKVHIAVLVSEKKMDSDILRLAVKIISSLGQDSAIVFTQHFESLDRLGNWGVQHGTASIQDLLTKIDDVTEKEPENEALGQ